MPADAYDGSKERWPAAQSSHDNPRLALAVTPDDNKDVTNAAGAGAKNYAKALWIGGNTGAQTLSVIMAGDITGTAVSLGVVPQGTYLPIQVRRVMSTGTSVTSVVAFFD